MINIAKLREALALARSAVADEPGASVILAVGDLSVEALDLAAVEPDAKTGVMSYHDEHGGNVQQSEGVRLANSAITLLGVLSEVSAKVEP